MGNDLLAFVAFAAVGVGAIGLVAGLVEWVQGRKPGR